MDTLIEWDFEWDEAKAASNLRKHEVSFDTAILAFADPFALTWQDRIENEEYRWQTLGMVGGRLFLVAHTIQEEGSATTTIRIISAREANRKERHRYEHRETHH